MLGNDGDGRKWLKEVGIGARQDATTYLNAGTYRDWLKLAPGKRLLMATLAWTNGIGANDAQPPPAYTLGRATAIQAGALGPQAQQQAEQERDETIRTAFVSTLVPPTADEDLEARVHADDPDQAGLREACRPAPLLTAAHATRVVAKSSRSSPASSPRLILPAAPLLIEVAEGVLARTCGERRRPRCRPTWPRWRWSLLARFLVRRGRPERPDGEHPPAGAGEQSAMPMTMANVATLSAKYAVLLLGEAPSGLLLSPGP